MKQAGRPAEPRGGSGAHYFEAALKKAQYAIEDSRLDRASAFLHDAFGNLTEMARSGGSEARRSALSTLLQELRSLASKINGSSESNSHPLPAQLAKYKPKELAKSPEGSHRDMELMLSLKQKNAELDIELSKQRLLVAELHVRLEEADQQIQALMEPPAPPITVAPPVVATSVALADTTSVVEAVEAVERLGQALADKLVLLQAQGFPRTEIHRLSSALAHDVLSAAPAASVMAKHFDKVAAEIVEACKIQAVALVHVLHLAQAQGSVYDGEEGDSDPSAVCFLEAMTSLVDEQRRRFDDACCDDAAASSRYVELMHALTAELKLQAEANEHLQRQVAELARARRFEEVPR